MKVTDSDGFSVTSSALSYTVYADPSATTPSASRTSVDVGQGVTFSTTASGGSGSDTYSWSGLPTGCSGSTNTVDCTPTGYGAFTISVTVTDSNGYQNTSSSLSYTVDSDPSVTTPSASPVSVDVGQSVTIQTTESGGSGGNSYAWSGLPNRAARAPSESFTCKPSATGTYDIGVTVTDSNSYSMTASQELVFVIDSAVSVGAPSASTPSVDPGQSVTFAVRRPPAAPTATPTSGRACQRGARAARSASRATRPRPARSR